MEELLGELLCSAGIYRKKEIEIVLDLCSQNGYKLSNVIIDDFDFEIINIPNYGEFELESDKYFDKVTMIVYKSSIFIGLKTPSDTQMFARTIIETRNNDVKLTTLLCDKREGDLYTTTILFDEELKIVNSILRLYKFSPLKIHGFNAESIVNYLNSHFDFYVNPEKEIELDSNNDLYKIMYSENDLKNIINVKTLKKKRKISFRDMFI